MQLIIATSLLVCFLVFPNNVFMIPHLRISSICFSISIVVRTVNNEEVCG